MRFSWGKLARMEQEIERRDEREQEWEIHFDGRTEEELIQEGYKVERSGDWLKLWK